MMGIDIDQVIVFAFVLGSALAGAAGVLFALRIPTSRHDRVPDRAQGLHGGGDRRHRLDPGRDGGGLVLGFAESYTQGYISTRWSDLLVFVRPDPLPAVPAAGASSAKPDIRKV